MSTSQLLRRVIAMDHRELWFRAVTAGRREAGRVAYLARRPQWHRAALVRALHPDDRSLRGTFAALRRNDWTGAHDALMRHFATRPARFIIDPACRVERTALIVRHHPEAAAEAAARADRIVAGQFDLLGYHNLSFSNGTRRGEIDWHLDPINQRRAASDYWSRISYLDASSADHKVVWELNRHQSWLQLGRAGWLTGDTRYRNAFITQFDGWMRSNPPLHGMNWASMLELAFRCLSWIWALHFFAGPQDSATEERTPWTVDLLLGLDRQLTQIERNLSTYFSPNTHLIGEALALYVAGRTLPELRRSVRWESIGRAMLIAQISQQVHGDGGHVELSTHYHRYTLDFYLLALAVARQTSDPLALTFAAAVERLAEYARTMSDDTGRLPMIGDDDGGSVFPICGRPPVDCSDSLQVAAQLLDRPELAVGPPAEEAIWITGTAPPAGRGAPVRSTALRASGYFVSRSERGDHLVIDAGPHGYLNGGHAHADALSVTLGVRGQPLLIDPGTACYTSDPVLRDRFRSTRYHNTLMVDERPQSLAAGPFHWHSTASATAYNWRSEPGLDVFEGTHDGYRPLVHQRTVLARSGLWIFVDRLLGRGTHLAEAHWHLDPAWAATRTRPRTIRAEHEEGIVVWLLSLHDDWETFRGCPDTHLGWCAPVYGSLVPTTTIRAQRTAAAPFEMVTVIVEAAEEPSAAAIVDAHHGLLTRTVPIERTS
jgi:hypothetical protein